MVERLSPEDARILALESGNVRGHTCKLLIVEGELDAEAVRRLVGARIRAVPRLRMRLAPAPLGLAPPAWVDDESFRVERHVRGGRGPLDADALRVEVARLMAEPLDRGRPLWAMEVLALEARRTALVWRLHHAMADGTVAMRMARALLFDSAEPEAPPEDRAGGDAGALDALRWRGAATARGVAEAGRAALSPPTWAAAAQTVVRLPSVLRRELGRGAADSPLDRPAGPRREVAFVHAPLEQLKAIGHGAPVRATVNDVVLTAVAGGLRRWLAQAGAPEVSMRVKVPVSLHQPGEALGANRDSFICVDLPLAGPDPLARLRAVTVETRERKAMHDAQTLAAFFSDLSHLSRSLERFAEHWAMSPRVFTLNVSNVPGPPEPQRILGAPLLELHSIAEIAHRHALRVAVVSAAGRVSFGLCADPDAVGDLHVLAAGIGQELSELSASL